MLDLTIAEAATALRKREVSPRELAQAQELVRATM